MFTIEKENIYEFTIQKSVFISYFAPAQTVDEAKTYIKQIKASHPNATHHVTAYLIGRGAEYGHFSDDGEPSGTAGLPIFEVLRKNDLSFIVSVVVRYYGGIKLGAGGLVRAYTKSISENIKTACLMPIIEYISLILNFDYSYLKSIENILSDDEIIARHFKDDVTLIVKIPENKSAQLQAELIEKTNGQIKIKNKQA